VGLKRPGKTLLPNYRKFGKRSPGKKKSKYSRGNITGGPLKKEKFWGKINTSIYN